MAEIYISTDIESDGPIPGPYSMLNFGSAAITSDGSVVGKFSANLKPLPAAGQHPETMKFWARFPDIWEQITADPRDPKEVMDEYTLWLRGIFESHGKTVFVGYPAGFDFTFIRWYLIYFTGDCPFGFQALDMKSYAMAKLGTEFKETVKKRFPGEWKKTDQKHTHLGIDDAIEQGLMFINMLKSKQ